MNTIIFLIASVKRTFQNLDFREIILCYFCFVFRGLIVLKHSRTATVQQVSVCVSKKTIKS